MKKSLIYLLVFCFAFCLIFTACATKAPQNTDGSQSTESSQSTTETKTSATEETTESTSQQTTKQSTEATTTAKTTQKTTIHPDKIGYTETRETKVLKTEIPELQEKIDRNNIVPQFPVKFIVQIGDQRDVPYLFYMGGGQQVDYNYRVYPYFGGSPYFSEIQAKREYIPTYTYSGTETVTIELDDEIYSPRKFEVTYFEGDNQRYKDYSTLQEMYKNLPKGTYYVSFHIEIYGNYMYGPNGNYMGQEFTYIVPVFILHLK